ncbi:L-fuculose phosphate aldolase [Mycolicibacterium vanbaalenii]|uniref:L-fuculose phosphate aldolase n=1 Tax=Mycolicibacterium vanbaalenii TaxID=110539 RepID=A0A5S9R465_MYCVN|nr:class II aldolase/adducin family protein [Mycolicibacterium vanbaalenii]CAA0128083.1 L-fuculose phosphate aldolase [Mycolicibacterium vanbaalenii]
MTTTEAVDQLREALVTCTRLLVFAGVLDYSGHVSARIPGTDLILIQPRDLSRASLTQEDILVVDLDGGVVEGDVPPPAETAIHTGVYRARPDIGMVCHGHPTLSTSFSMVDTPLMPMRHFAYKHPAGLAVHPDPTHIRTREQGDAVAGTLADADACLLRSHGTVLVADRFDVLFMDCLDLEENARTLLIALQTGGKLLPLNEEEISAVCESYDRGGHRRPEPARILHQCRDQGAECGFGQRVGDPEHRRGADQRRRTGMSGQRQRRQCHADGESCCVRDDHDCARPVPVG